MYTPDGSNNKLESNFPEWHEPFPEPQTYPARWDLSEARSISARYYILPETTSPESVSTLPTEN